MFLKAATAVLGMSMALAQTNHNDGDGRFFIATFNLNEFPVAVDICNPLDILGSVYQKAVCVDEENVDWEWHNTEDCSGTAFQTESFNTSSQNGYGFFGDFNCDESASDSYATVAFTTTNCNTNKDVSFVSMNAAVGICAFTGYTNPLLTEDDYTSIELYCEDDSWVELQYYDATTLTIPIATCTDTYLESIANGTNTCDFMLSTSGTKVFGYIDTCTINGTTIDDYEGGIADDSASALSMTGLLVVSIIAALSF